MLGRNPFSILACLIVALAVRYATAGDEGAGWGRLVRLAAVFAVIGVVFNLVTYHGGDRSFAEVPGWIPIVGGPLTVNAVVYGVLSGLALVTLVSIWSTVAQHLNWTDLVRLAPPALTGIAISSSIALTLVPKTIEAFGDIRDAQAIRGFRVRGARDLVPLAAPMLTLGLERAVTMSEALESRGFGGPEDHAARSRFGPILLALSLTLVALAAFLFTTGDVLAAMPVMGAGVVAGWLTVRRANAGTVWRPSRYRPVVFRSSDRWLALACVSTVVMIISSYRVDAGSLAYEPYPAITWPTVSLPVIAAIGLLLAPLFAPVGRPRGGQ
jgi:energy-coupling factor transport system permease protein